MRLLMKLLICVLGTGMLMAQSNLPAGEQSGNASVNDELKALRQSLAEQQKQMALQQQQMEQQKQAMALQQQRIDALQKALDTKVAAHVENASLTTNVPANNTPDIQSDADKPKTSPLSVRIGGAEFTPGGFVDFENVFRSTNTTNAISTNYGQIPFSNTVQGHLTEYRSTGQYSRFNLKTTATYGKNDITGYIEFDFNGNDAANVFVTANGHTDRLRLYWLDLKRGKWEFLGGQTWGLQTPNRVGASPNPADLSLGYQEDANIGVGYNYTRAAAFRATYHFNDNFVWAAEVQNPQQYIGVGEVVFPFLFNAQLGTQFDSTNNNAGTPNVAPDFLTKIAYDSNVKGRNLHFEAGAMETAAKNTVIGLTPNFVHNTKVGGGVFGAINYDLYKGAEGRGLRVVSSGMWGNGIGRYLNGLGPNLVVRPDGEISMVHAGNAVFGVEAAPAPKTQLGFYYGGAYFQRNFFLDPTNPVPGRFAGFGAPNSPNTANRAVQEGTVDWTQTFWRNPQYGAVLLITQASYVTRAPWFVAPGAPKNAHLTMGYVSLRYVLP